MRSRVLPGKTQTEYDELPITTWRSSAFETQERFSATPSTSNTSRADSTASSDSRISKYDNVLPFSSL